MLNDIATKILDYLKERGNFREGTSDADKAKMFYLDAGVIDSLGIIELVAFIEDTFGIQFTADHMQSSDFRTVEGLAKLVASLKQ